MGYVYTIDQNRCKGCLLCVATCPKEVLAVSDSVNAKGYFPVYPAHPEKCIYCGLCAVMCPDVAITIADVA